MPVISQAQYKRWQSQIKDARCEDQADLQKQLRQLKKKPDNANVFEKRLESSIETVARFGNRLPSIVFPEQLPVSQRKKEIIELISNHQIVIVAGETGSGKTTQLPKICLSMGLGTKGLIGHTQPRRIAARTIADRIASELKTPLGDIIGYQVRFKDVSSIRTQVKLMTDGVLLTEFQRDKLLSRYEVIIIDEAHERSLNIDFLLGLLKPLCKKRPDLKVIITSATIDLAKFSEHFASNGIPVPVIEVSGRTYPVEIVYQPPEESSTLVEQITKTVKTIIANEAKGGYKTSGDVLVFCAGEREIRDASQGLRRSQLPIEVLPLYSRLSVKEQNRVFQSTHRRKVVLATNVAETSITVPGIAYVIDPGTARIARYSFRSKVQRLPVEAISQASANQRLGRCGRVANGVCFRLYSEEDFQLRSEFTTAEILRSNLAAVILKMLSLNIYHVEGFDFIDQPDKRLLNDGFKLLTELGAINKERRLTNIGRKMSDLPIDPRFARILVAAQQSGCLRDALIVISGLSIQDPRERPADKQRAANQAHSALSHPQSDFYSYLHLWQAINNDRAELSNTKFKQRCAERYWSIARIFEWRELYRQLIGISKTLHWHIEPWEEVKLDTAKATSGVKQKGTKFSARYELLHKALLSGLLTHIATHNTDNEYSAARGRKIAVFPGSSLAKQHPKWMVSASFLETSRLFAHTNGTINPAWAIDIASHLCKYSYSKPHYHARSGTVKAQRKTMLYGLCLLEKESVNYGPINPSESRTTFIQQALVDQQYHPISNAKQHDFLKYNSQLIADIEKLEIKTRRRNLLVSEQHIFKFYDERIPETINNRLNFEKWLIQGSNHKRLRLSREQLLTDNYHQSNLAQFPDHIDVLGKRIKISYTFNPGQPRDGVTMIIPIAVLAPFPMHVGDWLVPGLIREKCIALIKILPKSSRRHFAPATDSIDQVINDLIPSNEPLHLKLAEQLFNNRGVKINPEEWDLAKLDAFYCMNYQVVNMDGTLLGESRNLSELKSRHAQSIQPDTDAKNAAQRTRLERHNLNAWSFGDLAESIEYQHQGMTITAYPMLKVMGDASLSLLISDHAMDAHYQTNRAILTLAKKTLAETTHGKVYTHLKKELLSHAPQKSTTGLSNLANELKKTIPKHSDKAKWQSEIILASLQQSCFPEGLSVIRQASQFKSALHKNAKHWLSQAVELESTFLPILRHYEQLLSDANAIQANDVETDEILEDIKAQLYRMFEPSFLRYTSLPELKQYPRYLRAIDIRIQKLRSHSLNSAEQLALKSLQQQFDQRLLKYPPGLDYAYTCEPKLKEFAILLQEWRVSLFAQHLRTPIPVSEKRLRKTWSDLIKRPLK